LASIQYAFPLGAAGPLWSGHGRYAYHRHTLARFIPKILISLPERDFQFAHTHIWAFVVGQRFRGAELAARTTMMIYGGLLGHAITARARFGSLVSWNGDIINWDSRSLLQLNFMATAHNRTRAFSRTETVLDGFLLGTMHGTQAVALTDTQGEFLVAAIGLSRFGALAARRKILNFNFGFILVLVAGCKSQMYFI
jgi:hypothetical protein